MNLLAYIHLRRLPECTGVGRVAGEYVERLQGHAGVNLQILADREDHRRVHARLSPAVRTVPFRLFSLDASWQQARWLAFDSPKAEGYWSDCDVVWCPAESYVPTKKARLAVTVHDVQCFEAGFPVSRGRMMHRMKWKVLFGALERRADAIITVSQFSADRIAHYFPGLARRVQIIHHGVSDRFLAPVSDHGEDAIQSLGLADKPFVLVPGGLSYRKNADLALAAWASLTTQLRRVELVVSGSSDPRWVARAGRQVSSVRFLGYVDDETLRSLYEHATLVWFPSRYEGFGLPIVEAMACGAPVVASRAAAIPEVAGSAAVLLDPHKPEEHVEAICALFESAALRDEYRRLGRARAAEFSWKAAAEKLAGTLTSL